MYSNFSRFSGFSGYSFLLVVSVFFSLLLSSCTTDPVFNEVGVEVRAVDLPPLDPAEGHYQLWFSYPDDPVSGKRLAVEHSEALYVSFGTFVVDEDGTVRGVDGGTPLFTIPAGYNPSLLADAILTVERPGDDDDIPSVRFLSGAFTGTEEQGIAVLTLSGNDAFGRAFDTISGAYRLITLSTESTDDDNQGIWFIDLIGLPTLELKAQPVNRENKNWTYESWLIRTVDDEEEYISLGTFNRADTVDANEAGPNAGPDLILRTAPGEDFVQGTTRILDDGTYNVMITLQPIGITLDRPYYPLLKGPAIPKDIAPLSVIQMTDPQLLPAVEITVDR